jgi:alcohol dehydrogenase
MVLMGSSAAPLPVSYMAMMLNNLEIMGNFMYPPGANQALLEMVRSGQLDLRAIKPKVLSLADLRAAMEYAVKARSLELVVVTAP